DIGTVGIEIDLARSLQGAQGGDRGHQLHAVVGGFGLAAGQLLFDIAITQDGAPAAGAGIAGAGAIGEDIDMFHRTSPYSAGLAIWRWKRSLRRYSSGSFFVTMAPGGVVSQS